MVDEQKTPKLKVIVVGAGICGLACGVAMRSYADVTILESSKEIKEIGAAVHLAPNSHRLVRGWGGDLLKYGSVVNRRYREMDPGANVRFQADFDTEKEFGCPWILCHRVDVQNELKRLATDPAGEGEPCKVVLDCRIASCDPATATVTDTKGNKYSGDIVIGADGIKSAVRSSVVGSNFHSEPSQHSAYRFLLPREKIEADPELAAMGFFEDCLTTVDGGDKRIVAYPCRDRKFLNFVVILPDSELNEISEEKWTARGNTQKMVESFSSFNPKLQKLLGLAEDIGLWQLRDQEPLQTWIKDRAIIVGDAAHAMLPHQGQGASQALEDAEALGVFLATATAETAPQALKDVFRVRYKRATQAQEYSRTSGMGEMRRKQLGLSEEQQVPQLNAMQFRGFMFGYFGAERWEKEHPEYILSA